MITTTLRSFVSRGTRALPKFRGLGRCVLVVDQLLSGERDPHTYETVATINGDCRLLLDLRNWEQKFAYYYGTLESELIAAVKQHYHGGVFYDIGASIGLYTVTFAPVCRRHGGYVRAIEPLPMNADRLKAQLLLNGIDDSVVRIDEIALGDSQGFVEMVLVDRGKPGNAKITTCGDVRVPMTTLDDLWRSHGCEQIGFMKIDTEGWDAKIILGGREAITSCRPNLLVEFNRERMRNNEIPIEPCWEFLIGELDYCGYRLGTMGELMRINTPGDFENILLLHKAISES